MFAHSLRQIAGSRLTLGLLVIWLAIELWRSIAFAGSYHPYIDFGLSRNAIQEFRLWQMVTYAFLHGGWTHVIMNGLLLLTVGSRLEWILGRRSYGLLLLLGALAGGILHLALSDVVLIGGSGVVFALMLCLTTLSPESRWLMPFPVSSKNLGRGLVSASLILLLIDPSHAIPGLSSLGVWLFEQGLGSVFGISHACHFGGALSGWLMALWVLRKRVTLEDLQRDRARRENGI